MISTFSIFQNFAICHDFVWYNLFYLVLILILLKREMENRQRQNYYYAQFIELIIGENQNVRVT